MEIAMFDTNILIDHLKGQREASLLLKQCFDSNIRLACSVITRIELLSGMRVGEESQIDYFLSAFDKVDVNDEIAKTAGQYMREYRKSHGINIADAIIAASALSLKAKLYTLNAKHFPMDDIVVIRPYYIS